MQEVKKTKETVHLNALEEKLGNRLTTMSQTIKKVEQLVDANMFEIQQEVQQELNDLRKVREEMQLQNDRLSRIRDENSNTTTINYAETQKQISAMIDEKIKQTRQSIDNMMHTISEQSKEKIETAVQEMVVMLADKYKEAKRRRRTPHQPSVSTSAAPEQFGSMSASSFSINSSSDTFMNAENTENGKQSHGTSSSISSNSTTLPPRIYDQSSNNNNNNTGITNSSSESAQQRKARLKELYKELAVLEMEVIKDTNSNSNA